MSRCDDYCCNHGCNQGRNCPARVAPIGRRTPRYPEQLPESHSRIYLRSLARALLLTFAVMLVSGLTVALIPKSVRYDCATAEIHPDVPSAVKTECRKKRTTA